MMLPAPRIRERYAENGDTNEAIRDGIAATGRLTGAALIIVVVFTGFAAGSGHRASVSASPARGRHSYRMVVVPASTDGSPREVEPVPAQLAEPAAQLHGGAPDM